MYGLFFCIIVVVESQSRPRGVRWRSNHGCSCVVPARARMMESEREWSRKVTGVWMPYVEGRWMGYLLPGAWGERRGGMWMEMWICVDSVGGKRMWKKGIEQ